MQLTVNHGKVILSALDHTDMQNPPPVMRDRRGAMWVTDLWKGLPVVRMTDTIGKAVPRAPMTAQRREQVAEQVAHVLTIDLAAVLFGLAMYGAVAGIGALIGRGDDALAREVRGWGLIAAVVVVAVSVVLLNRRDAR